LFLRQSILPGNPDAANIAETSRPNEGEFSEGGVWQVIPISDPLSNFSQAPEETQGCPKR